MPTTCNPITYETGAQGKGILLFIGVMNFKISWMCTFLLSATLGLSFPNHIQLQSLVLQVTGFL